VPGELQGFRIKIHSDNATALAQRRKVPADAAAQVGQERCRGITRGAVGCRGFGGRLLQPITGEQHLLRAAELGAGGVAQRLLGECRGDQARRVTFAQRLGKFQRPVRSDLLAREPVQQLAAASGQQRCGQRPVTSVGVPGRPAAVR
jgi:hypothetical protein